MDEAPSYTLEILEPLCLLFTDPELVARYAQGPVKLVPGLQALHQMATLLLAECVPPNGNILVLGAGGGLELTTFAQAHADWRFVGIDPSAQMLTLAQTMMGPLAPHAQLHEGYIDTAPAGPFDGATCLLTLHFLTVEERLHTLKALHQRLKPGAPLVVAHHSFPQAEPEKTRWLRRYAAFAASSGVPETKAQSAIEAIGSQLPLLSPEDEVALLQAANFEHVELFYAGFTFKGWVAYAAL